MFLRRTKGLPFPAFLWRSQGGSLQFWGGLCLTFYFLFWASITRWSIQWSSWITVIISRFFHDVWCHVFVFILHFVPLSLCVKDFSPQKHCNLQTPEVFNIRSFKQTIWIAIWIKKHIWTNIFWRKFLKLMFIILTTVWLDIIFISLFHFDLF